MRPKRIRLPLKKTHTSPQGSPAGGQSQRCKGASTYTEGCTPLAIINFGFPLTGVHSRAKGRDTPAGAGPQVSGCYAGSTHTHKDHLPGQLERLISHRCARGHLVPLSAQCSPLVPNPPSRPTPAWQGPAMLLRKAHAAAAAAAAGKKVPQQAAAADLAHEEAHLAGQRRAHPQVRLPGSCTGDRLAAGARRHIADSGGGWCCRHSVLPAVAGRLRLSARQQAILGGVDQQAAVARLAGAAQEAHAARVDLAQRLQVAVRAPTQ